MLAKCKSERSTLSLKVPISIGKVGVKVKTGRAKVTKLGRVVYPEVFLATTLMGLFS